MNRVQARSLLLGDNYDLLERNNEGDDKSRLKYYPSPLRDMNLANEPILD